MTDMRVGSLSTDRWVETRLGAKYHDKLPPQNKLVIDGRLPCLYIFRQFFSISKKFTEIIICLNTVVYKIFMDFLKCLFQTALTIHFFVTRIFTLYTSYLAQWSFNPQKLLMSLHGSTRVFSSFSYSFMHNFSYMKICRLLFFK